MGFTDNPDFECSIKLEHYNGPGGDVVIPEGTTSIGGSAFRAQWDRPITSVVFPKSLVEIEERAFSLCRELKRVTIPGNVKVIGIDTFAGCASLTDVVIEEGVKALSKLAFTMCENLVSLTIPSSVTLIAGIELGTDMDVTVYLDDSLRPFDGCPNLTIHAPAGSYAEWYAKHHGIPFEVL